MKQAHALAIVPLLVGLHGTGWAQAGKNTVVVGNTAANPVPVVTQGTTAISGSVSLTGTPSVTLSGSPSVTLSGNPGVTLSGTPSVTLSGSPNVTVANAPNNPVPITGKVEIVPGPAPSQINYGFFGATSGQQSHPVNPPVNVSTLVMSSRDRLYLEFVGFPGLTIELFPGQTVVVPFPHPIYVTQVNSTCSDPDGLCEFFAINMLGTQQ